MAIAPLRQHRLNQWRRLPAAEQLRHLALVAVGARLSRAQAGDALVLREGLDGLAHVVDANHRRAGPRSSQGGRQRRPVAELQHSVKPWQHDRKTHNQTSEVKSPRIVGSHHAAHGPPQSAEEQSPEKDAENRSNGNVDQHDFLRTHDYSSEHRGSR